MSATEQHLLVTTDGQVMLMRQRQLDWLTENEHALPIERMQLDPTARANAQEHGVTHLANKPCDTLVEILSAEHQLAVCDFCSGEPVTVGFDCTDFETHDPRLPKAQGSKGEWFACASCATIVRERDRRKLAEHCERIHRERGDSRAEITEAVIDSLMNYVHKDFFDNWSGKERELA